MKDNAFEKKKAVYQLYAECMLKCSIKRNVKKKKNLKMLYNFICCLLLVYVLFIYVTTHDLKSSVQEV